MVAYLMREMTSTVNNSYQVRSSESIEFNHFPDPSDKVWRRTLAESTSERAMPMEAQHR